MDANPASKLFYLRTKGETERDVIALDFQHTHIFQPSMMVGVKKEKRSLLEGAPMRFWPVLNPLLVWKGGKYKGITGEDIARAMCLSAKNQTEKLKMDHRKEMQDLL